MSDAPPSFWRDRRVFVTGATGLLGTWLVEELLRRGADVTCLVRDRVPGSRFYAEGVRERTTTVNGDVADHETVLRALNEHECDTVFHLAAQTIVGTASRSVLSTFETNVKGTWVVLDACRELKKLVKRVIVASSDKAYGVHDALPYVESAPLKGRWPYDVSKSCSDLIALSFAATYGVPVAVTRCGNLYGGGDLNWSRIVPGTLRSAFRGERPIIRSDGTLLRDYFYVEDAVAAYLLLAERLEVQDLGGRAFNFGTGKPVRVSEIVAAALAAAGRAGLPPIVEGRNDGEIPAQWLDCTAARETLGFRHRFELEEGMARAAAWYRAHLGV
ncbi:MAG TPA: NAD-dependent epimerase/dehydratase family protein [Planctomycetota bacterium]|nr:NAD-dependent epimerase/dehydratase family protein [Planctomycetota bacterium]